jgi:hypothetical protein
LAATWEIKSEDHVQPATISGGQHPKEKVLMLWYEVAVSEVAVMREIHIKLRRNDESKDWSMEINGRLHEHVSDEGLTDLVEGALIVAATSLMQASVSDKALQSR